MKARFALHLSRAEVALAIRGFEDRVHAARPDVRYISVEPVCKPEDVLLPVNLAR